jgi:hypothetical protein
MLSRSSRATSVEQFSSIGIEQPPSILMDGDMRAIGAASDDTGIGSEDHCLFVDGEWNCVGERCSNATHRLDY